MWYVSRTYEINRLRLVSRVLCFIEQVIITYVLLIIMRIQTFITLLILVAEHSFIYHFEANGQLYNLNIVDLVANRST